MATATQVPWNAPGGTPCCCSEESIGCPTTSATGNTITVTRAQALALKAGGTLSFSATGPAGYGCPSCTFGYSASGSNTCDYAFNGSSQFCGSGYACIHDVGASMRIRQTATSAPAQPFYIIVAGSGRYYRYTEAKSAYPGTLVFSISAYGISETLSQSWAVPSGRDGSMVVTAGFSPSAP